MAENDSERHELVRVLLRSLIANAAQARYMRMIDLTKLLDLCIIQAAANWQGIDPDYMTQAGFAAIIYQSEDPAFQLLCETPPPLKQSHM